MVVMTAPAAPSLAPFSYLLFYTCSSTQSLVEPLLSYPFPNISTYNAEL
jgi:hypothetical protein